MVTRKFSQQLLLSKIKQKNRISVFFTKQYLSTLLFAVGFILMTLVTGHVMADGDDAPLPDVSIPPTAETVQNTVETIAPEENESLQQAMDEHMIFLPLIVSSAPNICGMSDNEMAIFEFAQTHSNQGRASMNCDPILTQVARAKAQDMAERSYFNHVDPDGFGPNYHARTAGYLLPTWYGMAPDSNNIESLAAGFGSAESAWTGWLNSSGHRVHVLAGSSFWQSQTNIGIGYYYDPASPYQHYWVFLSAPPES
ncbi:MAG: hypothetical protein GY943_01005 [Chloroflexi bacterium]|nr:hypothetical protein [Chloroflexota bacterium]